MRARVARLAAVLTPLALAGCTPALAGEGGAPVPTSWWDLVWGVVLMAAPVALGGGAYVIRSGRDKRDPETDALRQRLEAMEAAEKKRHAEAARLREAARIEALEAEVKRLREERIEHDAETTTALAAVSTILARVEGKLDKDGT